LWYEGRTEPTELEKVGEMQKDVGRPIGKNGKRSNNRKPLDRLDFESCTNRPDGREEKKKKKWDR